MKKNLFLVVALLLTLSFLIGCGNQGGGTVTTEQGGGGQGQQEQGGQATTGGDSGETHLVVVQPMMPTNFDPVLQSEIPAARAIALIYQTLVYQDENMDFVPGLATEWYFEDAQTAVFTLREGVRFHNGNIMTADDVVFSLNRAGSSPHVSAITNFIHEAVALDDHTVRLTTVEPFAPMLAHLAHTATSIVNREEVERIGDDEHGQNPVGTGPFRFYNHVAGDRFELVRFDDFNSVIPGLAEGQLPAIEHLTFRIVPEAGVRTIELETGNAHVLVDVAATEVQRIRDHADLTMYEIPNFAVNTWLGFNVENAPFNDIRVRQAIAYAINIEQIVDVAWAGLGSIARGPLPTTVGGAIEFPIHPVNIERARELMAEAGYADGFSTNVWLNEGNAMRADAATMIQAQLRALNIETTINIYEWGVLLPGTAAGEHDMALMGWTTSTGEADYGLYPLFHSNNFGAAGNRFFYHNSRVDYLINLGRINTDHNVRMEAYREAQEIIMEEMPLIPLWQAVELHAAQNNIGGLNIDGAGVLSFWSVYFR
ncbi:MAG: ABC transporter substrate-binding protein [Defluviitaleaceae bacterium]|nr:ABC transporter substrate-binding protein [Defluviitaleaceae bacterium]